MTSEISEFVKPIYEHLYDDPALEGRLLPTAHGELEAVPGVGRQVFFWSHEFPETQSAHGMSVMNPGEVCPPGAHCTPAPLGLLLLIAGGQPRSAMIGGRLAGPHPFARPPADPNGQRPGGLPPRQRRAAQQHHRPYPVQGAADGNEAAHGEPGARPRPTEGSGGKVPLLASGRVGARPAGGPSTSRPWTASKGTRTTSSCCPWSGRGAYLPPLFPIREQVNESVDSGKF